MEKRKAKRVKSKYEDDGRAEEMERAESEINKYTQAVRQVNQNLRMVKEIEQESNHQVSVQDLRMQSIGNKQLKKGR